MGGPRPLFVAYTPNAPQSGGYSTFSAESHPEKSRPAEGEQALGPYSSADREPEAEPLPISPYPTRLGRGAIAFAGVASSCS